MVEAEFLAFEILTLASSYFSTTHLAAQSILSTLTALTFQIPFPISIAASTRVANLIGATLTDAAKMSAKVVSTWMVFSFHSDTNVFRDSLRLSSSVFSM
jgi:MATE family multidrug resistance protein